MLRSIWGWKKAGLALVVLTAGCHLGEGFYSTVLVGQVFRAGRIPVHSARVVAYLKPDGCSRPAVDVPADSAITDQNGKFWVEVSTFGGGAAAFRACADIVVTTPDPGDATTQSVPIRMTPSGETVRVDVFVK
ncbi:MAG TPA: hypothetical protein VFQ38_00470 [Longimicrobiales bacterium]|nr:hypothetical protein [Longimicrobiales bacterium]